jgi:hypothetical protein
MAAERPEAAAGRLQRDIIEAADQRPEERRRAYVALPANYHELSEERKQGVNRDLAAEIQHQLGRGPDGEEAG